MPDATHAHVRTSQGGSETTHTGQRPTPIPNAHHQRPSPTPITIAHHPIPPRCHTHTELPPGPGPSSNLSLIPTRQTLPGSQSEQRSLAERQGSLVRPRQPPCGAPPWEGRRPSGLRRRRSTSVSVAPLYKGATYRQRRRVPVVGERRALVRPQWLGRNLPATLSCTTTSAPVRRPPLGREAPERATLTAEHIGERRALVLGRNLPAATSCTSRR